MRWPIRNQILLPFAALLVLVLGVVSALNAALAVSRTTTNIVKRVQGISTTLRDSQFPLTTPVLQQAKALSGAEIVLTNEAGEVQASSFAIPLENSTRLVPLLSPAGLSARFETPQVLQNTSYYELSPNEMVRSTGRERLVLHLLYPQQLWNEARWQAAYPPLVVGVISLLVVGLLGVSLASRISQPILRVKTQVETIATGRFEPLPVPERDDELRELAISVNTLVEHLNQMREVIQRSERLALLGQLSGGLAHHIRNTVTGAKLALQLHQRHCQQSDPESLAVAIRQLNLTEEHLKRFLAAGQPQPLATEACLLSEILVDFQELIAPLCQHRHVPFEMVGTAADKIVLLADRSQVRQIFVNLVLNSLDAVGSSGWVRLEWEQLGDQVRLRVLDSGPGPPATVLPRLFEAFATSKPEGVGLGLAVSRQIAEAHGGALVYSKNPVTCFEVRLPTHAN